MSSVFHIKLTGAEIHRITSNIKKKIHNESDFCHNWTGQQTRKGYGQFEFRLRGKKFKVSIHRLIYYLKNNCINLPTNLHVSHLCHNKLCIKIEHLSLEPARVNNSRQVCKNDGNCTGHYGFANCILN